MKYVISLVTMALLVSSSLTRADAAADKKLEEKFKKESNELVQQFAAARKQASAATQRDLISSGKIKGGLAGEAQQSKKALHDILEQFNKLVISTVEEYNKAHPKLPISKTNVENFKKIYGKLTAGVEAYFIASYQIASQKQDNDAKYTWSWMLTALAQQWKKLEAEFRPLAKDKLTDWSLTKLIKAQSRNFFIALSDLFNLASVRIENIIQKGREAYQNEVAGIVDATIKEIRESYEKIIADKNKKYLSDNDLALLGKTLTDVKKAAATIVELNKKFYNSPTAAKTAREEIGKNWEPHLSNAEKIVAEVIIPTTNQMKAGVKDIKATQKLLETWAHNTTVWKERLLGSKQEAKGLDLDISLTKAGTTGFIIGGVVVGVGVVTLAIALSPIWVPLAVMAGIGSLMEQTYYNNIGLPPPNRFEATAEQTEATERRTRLLKEAALGSDMVKIKESHKWIFKEKTLYEQLIAAEEYGIMRIVAEELELLGKCLEFMKPKLVAKASAK